MSGLNWDNLKQRRCPICGGRLLRAHFFMRCEHRKGGVYKVKGSSPCKFTIRKGRYKELGGLLVHDEANEFDFKTQAESELYWKQYEEDKAIRAEAKKVNNRLKKRRRWLRQHSVVKVSDGLLLVIMSKSFVTITVCPICGKDKNELLLDRRLKETFEMKTVTPEPCDDCRKKYLSKGVMLMNPDSGDLLVIKDEAFAGFFTRPIPKGKIAFCDQGIIDHIKKLYTELHGDSPSNVSK